MARWLLLSTLLLTCACSDYALSEADDDDAPEREDEGSNTPVPEGLDDLSDDAAIHRGFNDVEFEGVPGEIRVLVLDGYDGDIGEYEVRLDCPETS